MALVDKAAPEFETIDADGAPVTEMNDAEKRVAEALAKRAASAAAPSEKPAEPAAKPAESKTTAVATKPAGAVVVATSIMANDPYAALENQLHVNYNDLIRIMVTNGNVQNKETKQLLGDHVGLELISIQSHWVCSPGGKAEDKESLNYLKFSDDGETMRDSGEPLSEAVAAAKAAGYAEARIVERLILVGSLFYPGIDAKTKAVIASMQDELVQIDLAPRSMSNFKKLRIGSAYKIGKGLLAEGVNPLRVKLGVDVQSKNNLNWTDATFELWTDAPAA